MGDASDAMTTPRVSKSRFRFRPHFPRTAWGRLAVFGPLGLLAAGLVILIVFAVGTKVPLPETLPQAQTTLVTMADGSPLGSLQGEQNRTDIPLAQVPVPVRAAVLAAEDRNFYHEPGISVTATIRAAFTDLVHFRLLEGGSTITQQYVKNAYVGNRRTLVRKLQ
jgi:membrane peptidoglycan carboxypeptidase